jgi:hypothetical protein
MNSSGAHASGDRRCPVLTDEKIIQELQVEGSLSFLNAQKKESSLETNPKLGLSHRHQPFTIPRVLMLLHKLQLRPTEAPCQHHPEYQYPFILRSPPD